VSTVSQFAIADNINTASVLWMPATLGFYFSTRFCISYLFFQTDPQSGAAFSIAINLLLLLAVAFYSFGPAIYPMASALRVSSFQWVLMFLSFSLCSLLWTAAVSRLVALAYWCGMAADVLMVLILLRTSPADRVNEALMKGFVGGACVIALTAWLSPTLQDLRPGNDDFFTPNAIGFACAFGLFLTQYLARSAGWSWLPGIFLAITLLRSLSKTTIAAFVAGQILLLVRDSAMKLRTKLLIAITSVLTIAVFWGLIEAYYDVYTNAGNQAETLTGRIGIWAFVLERSLQQPWIGHGFHSFRNVIPPFGSFEAWHAHNELLQQFYTYGVVGVVLMIGIYGSFFRQVKRLVSCTHNTILLGLLLFMVVRGLADTERFDLSFPLWLISLLSITLSQTSGSREVTA